MTVAEKEPDQQELVNAKRAYDILDQRFWQLPAIRLIIMEKYHVDATHWTRPNLAKAEQLERDRIIALLYEGGEKFTGLLDSSPQTAITIREFYDLRMSWWALCLVIPPTDKQAAEHWDKNR